MTVVPSVGIHDLPQPLPAELTVLDVREPEEWVHGHIEGAVHIPLQELPDRVEELPGGRLLVVCKLGGRSAQATAFLTHLGRDAVNLDGGVRDWSDAGRPLVADGDTTPVVI